MSPVGASKAFIKQCQGIMASWYGTQKDEIQVGLIVDTNDGYGNYTQQYSWQPTMYRGLLRTVERIPGEMGIGDGAPIAGNFIVHIDATIDLTVVPDKSVFRANGKASVYVAQNAYNDKDDRLSNAWYCYRVE